MKKLPTNIQKLVSANSVELLNGYIRIINSKSINQFLEILKGKDFWESDIPFATTVFGDVVAWNLDGYIQLYKMTDGISEIVMCGDEFFAQNIEDSTFQNTYFDLDLFYNAEKKYGKISPDQCYAFLPIPALGGKKELNSIEIQPLLPYLTLLSDTF
ncbi:Domain of uncharacterised function (DUF1851) [uncultured Blautia sp.]|nr:Domain of uncharacterised function (DUF1851) [uncultured Blautia sp.]